MSQFHDMAQVCGLAVVPAALTIGAVVLTVLTFCRRPSQVSSWEVITTTQFHWFGSRL